MELTHFLKVEDIQLDVEVRDKAAVLHAAAELLSGELSADTIESLLVARERVASTGVGEGIAVPHASPSELTAPRIALLRTLTPVPFDAVDDLPVQLVIVVLAPAGSQAVHLRLLARIARLVRSRAVRLALLAAQSPEAVLAIVGGELKPTTRPTRGVMQ